MPPTPLLHAGHIGGTISDFGGFSLRHEDLREQENPLARTDSPAKAKRPVLLPLPLHR